MRVRVYIYHACVSECGFSVLWFGTHLLCPCHVSVRGGPYGVCLSTASWAPYYRYCVHVGIRTPCLPCVFDSASRIGLMGLVLQALWQSVPAQTYVRIHIPCICMCVCACVYIHIYIYIRTYIYAYIYIYIYLYCDALVVWFCRRCVSLILDKRPMEKMRGMNTTSRRGDIQMGSPSSMTL
jgi:hypothetical protein